MTVVGTQNLVDTTSEVALGDATASLDRASTALSVVGDQIWQAFSAACGQEALPSGFDPAAIADQLRRVVEDVTSVIACLTGQPVG